MSLADFEIPDLYASRYPQWRETIEQGCPLLAAALRFAVKNGIAIEYIEAERLTEIGEGVHAAVNPITKLVQASYSQKKSIAEFFNSVAHELEHRSQMDAYVPIFGSHQLGSDVNDTNVHQKYRMADNYYLPTVLDAAVLNVVVELDAHSFGAIVGLECNKAFKLPGSILTSRVQGSSIINTANYNSVSDNNEFIQRYANQDLIASALCLHYLKLFEEKYDRRPSIEWFEAPYAELQKMISPLWREAGYEPPFVGDLGITNLRLLEETIASYPAVDSLIREASTAFPKTGRRAGSSVEARL